MIRNIDKDETNKKNVFFSQESMVTIVPPDIVNLEIKAVDGVGDLLYSQQIYEDEKSFGIEMPVDRLLKITHNTIVLIGLSGCGKTRSCYDYARHHWCLYFDCTIDDDVSSMINLLQAHKPSIKTHETQQAFEELSKMAIQSLISSRMLVLEVLQEQGIQKQGGGKTPVEPFDWLCIQRSRRSRRLFTELFRKILTYPVLVISQIFDALKAKFNGRVIFDESQHLLTILESDYRSSKHDLRGFTDNRIDFPRSLFSFTAGCITALGLNSIWCGTHMRIKNMDLVYSAAGGKPTTNIAIFTSFTYLKPNVIFKLCEKWIKPAVFNDNMSVFEEAANFLQGRPRFFMSFLHNVNTSKHILASFENYRRDMTTNYDSSLVSSSPYYFWRDYIHLSVEPLHRSQTAAFSKRLVSDTLLKLCIDFLLGDGKSISFSSDLELLSTGLVMVDLNETTGWTCCMAEPLVLSAGVNYLADQAPEALMDYFAAQLFAPLGPANKTAQERGHCMELVIALRFIQGWWQEPELQALLPKWVNEMNICRPVGILDCRSEKEGLMFLQQLRNLRFPYVILPAVNAGPDIRYANFSCCVKTTWTPKSNSSLHITADECAKNLETMKPANWYKSQRPVQQQCSEELTGLKFVHMRFELPYTAPSLKPGFESGEDGNDYVICVNLESDFALKFFGDKFVTSYKKYVGRVMKN